MKSIFTRTWVCLNVHVLLSLPSRGPLVLCCRLNQHIVNRIVVAIFMTITHLSLDKIILTLRKQLSFPYDAYMQHKFPRLSNIIRLFSNTVVSKCPMGIFWTATYTQSVNISSTVKIVKDCEIIVIKPLAGRKSHKSSLHSVGADVWGQTHVFFL